MQTAKVVRELLKNGGIKVRNLGRKPPTKSLGDCDIAIAIGGDGTMLRAARLLAPFAVPMLGINAGGLGFLSAVDLAGFEKEFKRIFSGGFEIENRSMISVEVRRASKIIFGPQAVLNECVVRCSDQARAVILEVESRKRFVAKYFGDGLIISTPTGSTAYSLAVGGPVVFPGVDAFLLAPICPHSLTSRPLMTPTWNPLMVRMVRKSSTDQPQALVSLDGQLGQNLLVDDEVHIRRYDKPFRLMLPPERSHFDLLRNKLKWGER